MVQAEDVARVVRLLDLSEPLVVAAVGGAVRHTPGMLERCIAQDAAADELLGRDPLALLLGMMLDQHFGSGA